MRRAAKVQENTIYAICRFATHNQSLLILLTEMFSILLKLWQANTTICFFLMSHNVARLELLQSSLFNHECFI